MMVKFLDLKCQFDEIEEELREAIDSVILQSAFIKGPFLKKFEENFASYIGVPFCIGVGNGTDALEIAMEALNLPSGSEILVPALTFIASSEAVTRSGHKVVFCDIDRGDYTISIEDARRRITDKTKAIMAVHLYGHPCNMDAISELAHEFDLKVIEDCAQAHGSEYKGKRVGGFGDVATFSFFPGKNLGAYGDGGCVVCREENLATKTRMIANHGRIGKYDHEFEGRNSRLDGLQAAILDVKLRHLDDWIERRIAVADVYLSELHDIEQIVLPTRKNWAKQAYHLFVIQSPKRDELREFLGKRDIQTGIHYPVALPKLSAYAYLDQSHENMFANEIDARILSLPIGDHMVMEDAVFVAEAIRNFFGDRHCQ